MKNFRTILLITVLSLSVTPFLVKFLYGTPLFGMTVNEKIISAATFIGLLNGFQLIMFGLVCSIDYERRYRCSKKLGDLVAFPGLNFKNMLFLGDSGIYLLGVILSISLIYEHNMKASIVYADEIFFLLLLPGLDLVRLTLTRVLNSKNPFLGYSINVSFFKVSKDLI